MKEKQMLDLASAASVLAAAFALFLAISDRNLYQMILTASALMFCIAAALLIRRKAIRLSLWLYRACYVLFPMGITVLSTEYANKDMDDMGMILHGFAIALYIFIYCILARVIVAVFDSEKKRRKYA